MSVSLLINGEQWKGDFMAERVINITPKKRPVPLRTIHKLAEALSNVELNGLVDVIVSYENIGLVYDHTILELDVTLSELEEKVQQVSGSHHAKKSIEVPVCYELGLDWKEVEQQLSKTREEIIEVHHSKMYTVAMMGFLPGFLYLAGLDKSLACNRKKNPRTKIPPGAVGIGGTQTGIYALESPGGWQIIGQSPCRFFEASDDPPMDIHPGDQVRFKPISIQEFNQWGT